ncbi:uncharacterized protein [Hoplias malabaricus]|uniref:uncharacterized protein isoform X3 n=1 Tax=Hoplias malabaricus TaxID=27720 RepID=UPI0034627B70
MRKGKAGGAGKAGTSSAANVGESTVASAGALAVESAGALSVADTGALSVAGTGAVTATRVMAEREVEKAAGEWGENRGGKVVEKERRKAKGEESVMNEREMEVRRGVESGEKEAMVDSEGKVNEEVDISSDEGMEYVECANEYSDDEVMEYINAKYVEEERDKVWKIWVKMRSESVSVAGEKAGAGTRAGQGKGTSGGKHPPWLLGLPLLCGTRKQR